MRNLRALFVVAPIVAALGAAPAPAAVISQGAFRLGADALWSQGLFGPGQTVAVVDEGFGGLDASIAAGELPTRAQLTTRSFDERYGLDGRNRLGLVTEHGTRMAEILHDMAPGARLVLVNYNTVAEFVAAAEWVATQGIPVVSHSNSFLDGPFDGTGPAAAAVDRAAAAGVLWVNSAGNFAQRHWAGRTDATGTAIPLANAVGAWLDLHLSWRDPAARAEFTVERQAADGGWAAVARSTSSGPVSVAADPIYVTAGTWRVTVRQAAGEPQDLELISGTLPLGSAVAGGSVATPGDARGALTVAAVPWSSSQAAQYSSQGPTDDGRLKPDISGPTYVTANAGFPGTAGTSAATAHIAGAAVLVRERRVAAGLPVTPADLRAVLVAGAVDLGEPGPDPVYGAGMVRLDEAPPVLRARLVSSRSAVRVLALDDGTLGGIEVRIPGARTRVLRRAAATVGLGPLPRRVRVTVIATDMAGNRSVRRLWAGGRGR